MATSHAGTVSHGSIGAEDEDAPDSAEPWETLSEEVCQLKIDDSLKKLGNVRKKKMSKLSLKDILGNDSKNQLKGIKQKHEEKLRRKQKKIEDVHRFVEMYENKMAERRKVLLDNISKSEQNAFDRKNYWWKEEYKKYIAQKKSRTEGQIARSG